MKHTIPRLYAEDALITYQGISLTIRQFLCLVAGLLISLNIWMFIGGLNQIFWLRIAIALLPLLGSVLFGWMSIRSLPLEQYILIWLRYHSRPQLYLYDSKDDMYENI